MGGPSKSALSAQESITAQDRQIQQAEFAQSQANMEKMQKLLQPAIDLNKTLISGNHDAALAVMAPAISNITAAKNATQEQIYNSTSPGAARDIALAENTRGANNATAGTLSGAYSSAFDKLANIGSGLGSFSLQQLGGSISSGQAASSSNQATLQAGAAQKASTLGFLGSLAGGAGSALSGRFAH